MSSRSKPLKKKEFTPVAREVGPAANIEHIGAFVERKFGPVEENKGIGSSAREVGPAAVIGQALSSATREVGPAGLPNNVCFGSDGAIQQGSPLKTKPGKYGIISLFDGVSSVVRVLTQKLGCPPTAILLAENDEAIRRLVCTEFGYRTDEMWGYTTSGSAMLVHF